VCISWNNKKCSVTIATLFLEALNLSVLGKTIYSTSLYRSFD